ncbi:uncharacterized protein LOC123312565 [Coccinella septempunctata]|uniref:uncharacterized protein LOC123312565 n=1 Tax=Coccinella septempunctata TaxID=41139 RepID=UPI001D0946B3|nr:uncharacterized protein LOC123312565 [Coccinella septempunctata]
MVLTTQQQKDVKDIIRESFNDKLILSTLAHTVANLVIDKLDEKWNSLNEKIDIVEAELNVLREENVILREQLNHFDQQRRRKCIRLLGMEEQKGEDLSSVVKKTFCEKLKLQRGDVQIDLCHRVGSDTMRKRPIIVHFSSLQSRNTVFKNKSKLKGTKLVIAEDLTKYNYSLLKRVMERIGGRDVWTSNGKIYAKFGSGKMLIRSDVDLVKLGGGRLESVVAGGSTGSGE